MQMAKNLFSIPTRLRIHTMGKKLIMSQEERSVEILAGISVSEQRANKLDEFKDDALDLKQTYETIRLFDPTGQNTGHLAKAVIKQSKILTREVEKGLKVTRRGSERVTRLIEGK